MCFICDFLCISSFSLIFYFCYSTLFLRSTSQISHQSMNGGTKCETKLKTKNNEQTTDRQRRIWLRRCVCMSVYLFVGTICKWITLTGSWLMGSCLMWMDYYRYNLSNVTPHAVVRRGPTRSIAKFEYVCLNQCTTSYRSADDLDTTKKKKTRSELRWDISAGIPQKWQTFVNTFGLQTDVDFVFFCFYYNFHLSTLTAPTIHAYLRIKNESFDLSNSKYKWATAKVQIN